MTTAAAAPAPARRPGGWLRALGAALRGFARGFSVTLYYLFNPNEIVTEEYPDNRATLVMHPRFRGQVTMPHDDDGEHRCTACGMCEKACPNGTISILTTRNEAGQKVLGQYLYRYGQCTLCGLCVEACPYDAIRFGQAYEVATTDKASLNQVLNRKEGRP